jgi:histidinol-phosphate aminotransferase
MIFNKELDSISSYQAGKPIELVAREYGIDKKDIIKLASNENPYGCSKKVHKKIVENVDTMSMYPDDSFYELKNSLANRFDTQSDNIIIGNGSDQIIEFCINAKLTNKILIAGVTFAMYEIYAKMRGIEVIKTSSNTHNLDEFHTLYKQHKPDIIFLCMPNNPLGECIDKGEVFNFISKCNNDTLVVIDGAYQEYAIYKDKKKEIKPKELIQKFQNTIYLGTFSKAYGLGGMRIGYGISNIDIIATLHKIRPPFNITTLSLKASLEALKDIEHIQYSIKNNFLQMNRYIEFLQKKDIEYIESFTNFITILFEKKYNSTSIATDLLKVGIIVRDLFQYNMNAIRITIGTSLQNDIVLEKLSIVLDN